MKGGEQKTEFEQYLNSLEQVNPETMQGLCDIYDKEINALASDDTPGISKPVADKFRLATQYHEQVTTLLKQNKLLKPHEKPEQN
ncbi:MAG: hypothetical protein ACHQJ6_01585 [Candidatus Berkiellales bacterium]